MIRFLLASVAATVLLAAPVAASAATTAAAKPVAAKPAKHAMKASAKHGRVKPAAVRPRDSGAAAVDTLNEQSLAKARGAQ